MRLPAQLPLAHLTLPLRWVPQRLHSAGLALLLDRVLAQPLAEGELDFLAGKRLEIRVDDLQLGWCLTVRGRRLAGCSGGSEGDARICGDLRSLVLLAARREDADTLFFQRRLRMSGDTELGLQTKNFLDAFEPHARWRPLVGALERVADWIGPYFSRSP